MKKKRNVSPIGKLLLKFQQEKNLLQTELAKQLGMSQPFLSNIIDGSRRLTRFAEIQAIAALTGESPTDIALLCASKRRKKDLRTIDTNG